MKTTTEIRPVSSIGQAKAARRIIRRERKSSYIGDFLSGIFGKGRAHGRFYGSSARLKYRKGIRQVNIFGWMGKGRNLNQCSSCSHATAGGRYTYGCPKDCTQMHYYGYTRNIFRNIYLQDRAKH